MFVYSVRASTIKFFALILGTLLLLITFVNIGDNNSVMASVGGVSVNFGGMRSNEDRVHFIESFGIKVKTEPAEEGVFLAPENLDRVSAEYNEIQKAQGLDLTKYTGKRITHYKYEVENYNSDGAVYVNLLIYKNRVIGCDISSTDGAGFVLPLVGIDKSNFS